MRWLRISLFSLAGIIALLLTAIAVLLTVDFGRFKDRIEVAASDFLRRELRVDGALHANLGSRIELYAEDLYLANPEWAKEDAFVTADKIDVAVVTWSLINGPIEFERIEIDGVRINIEKNENGDASWSFEGLAAGADQEPKDESLADDGPVGRLPIMLDYMAINNTSVSYSSATMQQPLLFVADSLMSSIDGDDLKIVLKGSLNDTPLEIVKSISSIENLLEYRDVTVDIEGNIGEIDIDGSAWIDDLLSPRRPTLTLKVNGPNAEYLTDILMLKPVTTGPLDLSVSVQESGDKMMASLNGVFGEFRFDVAGHFLNMQALDEINLDVSADGPDIGAIIRLAGREYDELDAFSVRGKINRSGPEVSIENVAVSIGESQLTIDGFFAEFPTANGAKLSLVASGPDYGRFNRLLGMPGRLDGSFTTSLSVSPHGDGRTLIELDANAEHVRIQLRSLLSASEKFADTTAQLNVTGADIGVVAKAAGFDGLPAEEFDISGSVEKDRSGYRLENVRALVGDDLLQIDGHLGERPLAGDTDLNIRISGSDLGASIIVFGGSADNLPKGAYYLRGRVHKENDKLWLRDIESAIGDDDQYQFNVSGFLTVDQQFRDSQIEVRAKGASLSALAELFRLEGIPDFPFKIGAEVRRGSANTYFQNGTFSSGIVDVTFAGHVGDRPLEDDFELTFDADVPRMKEVIAEFGIATEQIPAGDLVASGAILSKSGKITINDFKANFEGAKLNASGRIGQPPSLDGTNISFSMSGDDLSRVLPPEFSRDSLAQPYALEGRARLNSGQLEVDRLAVNLGDTSVSGEFDLAMAPIGSNGRFSLRADSPDLFQLFPEMKDISVPRAARMKFRGGGNWSENYWHFEDVNLELGKGRISISGGLDGPPNFDRTDLNVDWHASSLRNFSVLAGRELPDHPLHLTARLVGTHDLMTMENFALTFGESDLEGDFSMRSGDVPEVKIDVHSRLFDVVEYFPEPEESAEPPPAPAPKKERKLIPDTPLPLELLRSVNADIGITIGELRTRAVIEKGVELNALLSNGALHVENLKMTTLRGGFLRMSGGMIPNDTGGARISLSVDGEDLVMGFVAGSDEELQQLPLFELRAELASEGATVRELAGSLDGYFRLVGAEGRLRSGSFSLFTQDFITEVIGAVNPFAKKDPYTNVECAVILLKFDDGVVEGHPALVQQTQKVRIFSNAKIDLTNEKLNADFKTVPRKGLGLSVSNLINPYVQVTGTLAAPSLVLDPESILIEGGVAVATAGLSILAKSFKDRFLSDKDPCGTAVAAADEIFESPRPAN